MAETVPERIWIDLQAVVADDEGHRVTYDSENIHQEYVPATALEAAQARIRELEARLREAAVLVNILTKEAVNARREALEEAAKVATKIGDDSADMAITGLPESARAREAMNAAAIKIAAAIRALMEKPNG